MDSSVSISSDERYIADVLKLAAKGKGWTSPNPMVGAIIVKGGKVIGKGYHHRAGADHAEIMALKSCREDPKDSIMYVNLEPCSHQGKTPPCSEAIIAAGISRVVCSTLDPNPAVHGEGIAALKKAKIKVSLGIFAQEAKALNESFFSFHTHKRPFIAIKFAASLDGKLATKTGDSKWITNELARDYARDLRSQYQAILVGSKTVSTDDPHLGSRQKNARDPLRIILDSRLRISRDAQVLRDSNVLIVTTSNASKEKIAYFRHQGFDVLEYISAHVPLNLLMKDLYKRGIISIFVEGGGQVLGSFIDEKLVDKVYAFYAPLLVGGTKAAYIKGEGVDEISSALRLEQIKIKSFGDNTLISGYLHSHNRSPLQGKH